MKDLAHYDAAIQSYLKHKLRSPENETKLLAPTLEIIKSLRKVCLYRLCRRGKNRDRVVI